MWRNMRVSRMLGQFHSLPLCPCCECTPQALHSLQGSTGGKHRAVRVDGDSDDQGAEVLSALPRARKVEVAVSRLRNLDSDVSPGSSLVNKSACSLLKKLKANFAFDSENVWEVVAL